MKQWIKQIPYAKESYRAILRFCESLGQRSYSQEGEDLILKRIFTEQKHGFYVDIGAHHPRRFSNTHLFYKRGWRGINIDAMPNSMKIFNAKRPRDINLETPIGEENQSLSYYIFDEPALNTCKSDRAEEISRIPTYKLIDIITLQTRSLKGILDRFLPPSQQIDFMSVDVEGLDLQVLQSNDWEKYRPKILLIEILGGGDMIEVLDSPFYGFLSQRQYGLFAKTFNTYFFRDTRIRHD